MSFLGQRNSVVASNDLIMCSAALVCSLFMSGWVLPYLLVVALMFGVSCMHHWLPYAKWHHKLDRSMIYVLIAGTMLPYFEIIFHSGIVFLFLLACISAVFGVMAKLLSIGMGQGFVSAGMYSSVGLFSLAPFPWVAHELGAVWSAWFLVGVFLYVLQMVIYNVGWPNPYPELESFRWFQRLVLDPAPVIHTILAIVFVM